MVVVPPRAPFGFLLARYAPTLGLVALGALVVGALLATRDHLRTGAAAAAAVEDAARRLGAGDLTARAPAQGGDEVAAVATAFNAMADDLAARAEALAASDRARRQLLADVSHELTTPITAMRGYLETLTMPEMQLDEPTRARYLGIIGDETSRLERIIGDLLDLARLEGGGGTLAVDDVAGRPALRTRRARATSGRCADAGRDASTRDHRARRDTVRGDRDRLEQALQNLAANALRYAPPAARSSCGAAASAAASAFTVTDQGPGIAPEHLPHVFDRFYKAEASRVSQHGRRRLARQRSRPVDRQGDRRTPRRHDHRARAGRDGHDLRVRSCQPDNRELSARNRDSSGGASCSRPRISSNAVSSSWIIRGTRLARA